MHPNPAFRKAEAMLALDTARARGFGTLIVMRDAPLVSHVPFLLAQDGASADLHLVRSNPICRAVEDGAEAMLVVQGPDGYVSPDWYAQDDQVPTWNYVAIHLHGLLTALPVDQMHALLARQSAHYEAQLDKTPWTLDKMTPDTLDKMMRMILPFRMQIADVHSTFKLNQNKPDAAREAAAERIEQGLGQDLKTLAGMMRAPPA